ncbi:TetR/AcrR family transcriptional regulator [Evansella cellulosilytica]|uniref:Transcriptional regulator, TetR family n=1 Tax=Evansella cellulosilytica (strain ATCC 21833 / DSM 2522 / FERM P-1141 / JCM 9156 / N-4) TaxID=649639 RepID=E6TVV6_EVAC2|nr:TetR/AcrR family transcriptional regulator [Evansella cellulosilytica]ADU28665.1 transcriptional regulator, TetR family [Evansella cellulosilytica DSM 2522]
MTKKISSKEKIIETASRLFQEQGYHATGLNQITKESGAPKGSLYYYFPDGKEQLASVAVNNTADNVAERIKNGLMEEDDPIKAIQTFIQQLASAFEEKDKRMGIPVAAVALETANTSEVIRTACVDAYDSWHNIFAAKLITAGYEENQAQESALVINALIEGAFINVIIRKDGEPLRQIAKYIPNILGDKAQY